jgi:DNA-3-methyladenine glycosylase I (EC 3.2.2.20)
VWNTDPGNVHRHYHDHEYGFPINDDNDLFARLVLEINQAGLSWTTILNKKENFFKAYDNFDIARVARYTEKKFEKLMQDAGIVRNCLKIEAAIENAKRIKDNPKGIWLIQKLARQKPSAYARGVDKNCSRNIPIYGGRNSE